MVFILEHRQRFEGISFYIGLKPIRGFLTLCANFRDISFYIGLKFLLKKTRGLEASYFA